MLNWVLAAIAAALWSTAYGWYFSGDVRRWLWRRRNRHRLAEMQRAQAYAAWVRRTSSVRARTPPRPSPWSDPAARTTSERSEAEGRPTAVIVQFPGRKTTRPPRD